MASYIPGDMDVRDHRTTYAGFIQMAKIGTVLVTLLLLAMAAFLV